LLLFLKLTAANRNDNFEFVAIGQHLLIELSARHDFTIALDSDTFIADLHVFD